MSLLRRIDHIGIAVHDLDAAVALYRDVYGVEQWERIDLPERHMAVAVCQIGDTKLELIAPTSDQAVFTSFLRDRGPGIHHIGFEVDNLDGVLRTVEERGVRLIDAHGRPGIHDTSVAFLHPRSTQGVLSELVTYPLASEHGASERDG